MRNTESLGDTIRNCRKMKNMTQKQLGELTQITQPLIAAYENNKTIPTYKSRVKIAQVLGIDIKKLSTDEEKRSKYRIDEKISHTFEADDGSVWKEINYDLFEDLKNEGFSKEQLAGIINSFDFPDEMQADDIDDFINSEKKLHPIIEEFFMNIKLHGYGITKDEYYILQKLRCLDVDDEKIVIGMLNRLYDLLMAEMVAYDKYVPVSENRLKINSEYGTKLSKRLW